MGTLTPMPPLDVRPGKLLLNPSGGLFLVLGPCEDSRYWRVLEYWAGKPPVESNRSILFLDGLEDA